MRPLALLTAFAGLACAAPAPRVVAVNVASVVHPITVEILSSALKQAETSNASAVLVRLNTPGGLLDATRQIVQHLAASPVPVIAYVSPGGGRAASAGFFILEAADVAAMAPGTNTGAASPVLLAGQMDPVMRNKIENDSAAWLRSLTNRRARNSDAAEKTIREAKAFTESEALDQHLIDLIAPGERDLLDRLDGKQVKRWDGSQATLHLSGAVIVEAELSMRERFIASIADPNIGFILLVVGVLAIYVEFTSPGLIFPGVAGAIMVLLGLSSLSVLPINWAGVALLCLAIALFVLEAKIASHGILGVGATAAMIMGALLLVNGPPEMRIHPGTALAVSIPFAAITLFLVSLAIRARRGKVLTGLAGMINEIGVAVTRLAPEGKVLVRGEYWDAASPVPVAAGARVKVTSVNGMKLSIEPLDAVPEKIL